MAISIQMQTRINKIQILTEKGYTLKTEFFNLVPKLTSPNGAQVNIYSGKYEDDLLPNFSWIAFFFPFAVAAQIRHWNYFYLIGIFGFLIEILALITKLDSLAYVELAIALLYGYWFPYQRWFFQKSNREDLGKIKSIFAGLGLSLVASIPAFILYAASS
tara:strand:- start:155 stop:634 length:480 start_codon:yes stop_codon:yes gene_type:complete